MSLSEISPFNREKEQESLTEIYKSIDGNKSIIFNSGAGAGKTFALIESLKYIVRNYEKKLKEHNQQIICITYTNVAAKEVKERLGNTGLIIVSTIHERIWALIKDYKKELVEIHIEKLKEEISYLTHSIKNDKEYEKYRDLDEEKKNLFIKIMIENKELFSQYYNAKAADLKRVFEPILNDFPHILSSVSHFRKVVNIIFKVDNYNKTLEYINLNKQGYKFIEYNSNFNTDQLHKMKISHDTLIEYGLRIIEKYNILKQIIVDQYPFIFIDEYQDTDEKVVKIMGYLEGYAEKIGHNFFVGYFGDTAQNIYAGGVGNRITDIHLGLKPIKKEFNRRSTKEVIDVINKIRNDNIKQISIYDDCEGGSVKFYKCTSKDVDGLIKKYMDEWKVTMDNQLHCLVLTNKLVAEYSGFKNIYEAFAETDNYKGINYNQLNTELLSNDFSKLGEIPKLLFDIVKLHNQLENEDTLVINISPKESIFDGMNLEDLRKLINRLKRIKGNTLEEYIISLSNVYFECQDEKYNKLMDWIFGFENLTYDLFKNHLIKKLFNNKSDSDIDRANTIVQNLLRIDLEEFVAWYKFIMDKQEDKVIYHTYHGTKGREFNNVIIIMGNSFGRNREYFNFFFKQFTDLNTLERKERQKLEEIKNLLYVSCSRAIKNLRVLYIDDIINFESGIKEIFGCIDSV